MTNPNLARRSNIPVKVPVAFWLLALLLALGLSCRSQPEVKTAVAPTSTLQTGMMYPAGFGPAVLGKPYPGTGVVNTINLKEGWVTIDHEEIKDLMPPMIMEFWVRDASIMKGLRVGDKVDFVVLEDSKGQYLTEIKKAAPRK